MIALKRLKAKPKPKAIRTTLHGKHRRLRVMEYRDGTARVFFRQPWLRKFSGQNSWAFVCDCATVDDAENVVWAFLWTIEKACDLMEIKPVINEQ